MLLSEFLKILNNIAKENNISIPYIVGGIPRDRILGNVTEINDIDITTGDESIFKLAILASKMWKKANFKTYDDGHSSLDFKNIRIDFSNNFNIPNIEKFLLKKNIVNPTNLEKEIYSRDFTINTLLQPLILDKDIIDITKQGKKDIKNHILKTPIDSDLIIGYSPKRIIRAIKFTIRFNLKIDDDLKKSMIKFRGNVADIPINFIKKQINQMLEIDARKTLDMLSEFKLLPILPLSKLMTREIVKNKMVNQLLDDFKL